MRSPISSPEHFYIGDDTGSAGVDVSSPSLEETGSNFIFTGVDEQKTAREKPVYSTWINDGSKTAPRKPWYPNVSLAQLSVKGLFV